MTARLYIRSAIGSNSGTYVETDARLRLLDWELREQAEEGSAAMSTVVLDDPDMDWDVTGWRSWYMVEDTSEASNSVMAAGWTADQEIGREGGDRENPLGRLWALNLADANAYWQMRVMVGSDCKRPAETDVARMQWVLSTAECSWATDTTTYVQTTGPVNMDAVDYRGQSLSQVIDDCSQASGRNWHTWVELVGGVRKVIVWYGHDSWEVYDSPLYLSNDPADWIEDDLTDGSSIVWPISPDTKLSRDPSRQFDGVYLPYDRGAVFRASSPRTVLRDFTAPSYNVKSSTKAIARANRYLGELGDQDEVITTTVVLPAAKATQLRAGMRVAFHATHLPGYETVRLLRVVSCSIKPVAAGERYALTVEMVGPGSEVPVPEPEPGDSFAALLNSNTQTPDEWAGSGDHPNAGWYEEPSAGALSPDQTSAPFTSITSTANMNVRIEAACSDAGVGGSRVYTFAVVSSLHGTILSDVWQAPGGLTFWKHTFAIDHYGYAISAGETLTTYYSSDIGPETMVGYYKNLEFFRVGRGTFHWNYGTKTWTGY